MKSERKVEIILGVLFLVTFMANMIGTEILEGYILSPDYLVQLHANKSSIVAAELLELLCATGVICMASLMDPFLRKFSSHTSRAYLGFRIMECIFMVMGIVISLSLLTLSKAFVDAGSPSDSSHFTTLGDLCVAGRQLCFKMIVFHCLLSYVVLHYSFFQTKLIPRFLSIWGILTMPLTFIAIGLELFGYEQFSPTVPFPGLLVFYLPCGLMELFLAVWLIVHGFDQPTKAETPDPDTREE